MAEKCFLLCKEIMSWNEMGKEENRSFSEKKRKKKKEKKKKK
jgi:hypothetical protein